MGRPSTSAKWRFITGNSASALTTANPIMCVKLILPPRVRRNWLLMTTRLSASSLAGTARTLVAVGTVSEAFMFFTTSDAAPRRAVVTPSVAGAGLVVWRAAACELVPAAGLAVVLGAAAARGAAGSSAAAGSRCCARLPGFSIGVSGEGAAVVSAAVCAADPEVGEASPGR